MNFRKMHDNTYQGTTWQIRFNLDVVNKFEIYTLRLALASANQAELQVLDGALSVSNYMLFDFFACGFNAIEYTLHFKLRIQKSNNI